MAGASALAGGKVARGLFDVATSVAPGACGDGVQPRTTHRTTRHASTCHAASRLDALPEAVVVTDTEGRVKWTNRLAESVFGYTRSEMAEFMVEQLVSHLTAATAPMGRHRDGHTFPVATRIGRADGGDLLELTYVIRDVSQDAERARVEAEFLANASHELRTPAATIRASAEVLADALGSELSAGLQQLLLNIGQEAERLGTLVDDLLDFERLRSGLTRPRLARCDLREVARRALDSIHPLARLRDQSLYLVVPEDPVWAVVDVDLLGRAIVNLAANAQKFGRRGGRVEMTLEVLGDPAPEYALFGIQDDGPGVPVQDLERIFERFYRSPTAVGRRVQGSGLGLPICRAAVELHGGRVWPERSSETGSLFRVTLPLRAIPSIGPEAG